MKKEILFLSTACLVFAVSGCKTFDPKLLNPSGDAFRPKLPAMDYNVESTVLTITDKHGNIVGASPLDVSTYFEREVDDLMTNPYGPKKGTMTLKVTNIETRMTGVGFIFLDIYSIFILPVLGVPLDGYLSSVEVEILVNNSQNELLGKYRGSGYEKFNETLYNGKLYTDGQRIAYLSAVKKAILEAKSKMIPDLDKLNKELNK